MSSGGGPRASGSGLAAEGKFRQRVETHYTLMANAKKSLRLAGKLQLVSGLGAAGAAGTLLVLGDSATDSAVWNVVGWVLALTSAMASRSTTAADGMQAELRAAAYSRWCSIVLVCVVCTAVLAAPNVGIEPPPQQVRVAGGLVLAIDAVGCMLGKRAASGLRAAFAMQKQKAGKSPAGISRS